MTTLFQLLNEAKASGDDIKWLCERVQKLEQQLADAKDRRDELDEHAETLQTRLSALNDAAQAMSFHSLSFSEAQRILYKGIDTHPNTIPPEEPGT